MFLPVELDRRSPYIGGSGQVIDTTMSMTELLGTV
jgi:hypothetical protein